MEIQSRQDHKATVVTVTGKMDTETASIYQQKMTELINAGATHLVVDFDGLEYLSSAGLRVILSTAKAAKAKGGQVCFANVKGMAKEVFELSNFNSIFKIYDSMASALAEIG